MRKIKIDMKVYNRLKARKINNETFSDLITRSCKEYEDAQRFKPLK